VSAPAVGRQPPRLGDVLVSRDSISRRVAELAAEVEGVYAECERPLVLVCVLKGSLLFTADLARALSIALEIEFVACRSYGAGGRSTGSVELVKDVSMPLGDRDVLMVEDIIDTGLTTAFLREHLAAHRPRSLRLAALLDKRGRRQRPVVADFRGFEIPDRFVVGYGLDLGELYRNLPDVYVVEGL
jgi:hypoxanthine phosphoribosyltransferase